MTLISEKDFKQFYIENFSAVRMFIYSKCSDIYLAEDIAQESFVRLWKNKDKVILSKARSFVFTVSGNLFLDHMRHEKVKNSYKNGFEIKFDTSDPQFILEMDEFKLKLEETIMGMPEGARVVFLLNRIEKMTYSQIAESLDLSVKAIEKRMQRALEIMSTLKFNK
ncbi:MAG: sigma-70 family RNA polymerase sigma factor [Saprospiraceae bacterium]